MEQNKTRFENDQLNDNNKVIHKAEKEIKQESKVPWNETTLEHDNIRKEKSPLFKDEVLTALREIGLVADKMQEEHQKTNKIVKVLEKQGKYITATQNPIYQEIKERMQCFYLSKMQMQRSCICGCNFPQPIYSSYLLQNYNRQFLNNQPLTRTTYMNNTHQQPSYRYYSRYPNYSQQKKKQYQQTKKHQYKQTSK